MMTMYLVTGVGLAVLLAVLAYLLALKWRHMDRWLGSYYFPVDTAVERPDWRQQPVDVFLAVCDHYEPQRDQLPKAEAIGLVERWVREYPQIYGDFRDASGRPPQHTFFFPQDEYQPEYLDLLKELCVAGYGDVDIHLHHENDTSEGFREKMSSFRDTLYHRHELLRKDPATGEIVYGFIHGNWTLCNAHPRGYNCGVNDELNVLRETGCYADFTLPSAPSPTQVSTINSIYYAWDRPGRPRSHETGQRAAVGRRPPENSLLMIQGPLVPDWKRAKWFVFPRTENGDLHHHRPATWERFEYWMQAHVHVQGRPDWYFVKLHTHGCKPGNIDTLLGEEMARFHRDLATFAEGHPQFRYHYVTAWEMAQLVHLAEAGLSATAALAKIRQQADQQSPQPLTAGHRST